MRSATQLTVSTFGVIMGLAGLEHGLGEILQGNVAPRGLMFPSWPDAAFFHSVNGEPAMSIVPNLLVTGILASLFSLIYLVWAVKFASRKHSGLVLMFLAIVMLLTGGGIFPPVLGFLIGALATRIKVAVTLQQTQPVIGLRQRWGRIWPGSFVICLIGWLLLFPGINMLGYFFGVNDSNLTVSVILFALGSLLVTILIGFARDSLRPPMAQHIQ